MVFSLIWGSLVFMRTVYLFIVVVLFMSCVHKSNRYNVVVPLTYKTYKNVVYGTDTIQQAMDVYLPKGRSASTPVVILLHGGAWVVGDKGEMNGLGIDSFFTANGFAVINMNYRLLNPYHYPDAVDDIGLVMKYIADRAGEWYVDAGRVCLLGRSAGAHLALLYAYSRNNDKRIKAVLDFYGPTDLTDSSVVYKDLGLNVTNLLGAYDLHRQAWRDASPLYYMNNSVPTAVFHGTRDSLVFYSQAERLADSLHAHHVSYMLNTWDGRGHGWVQGDWLRYRDATMVWIKQQIF